MNKKSGRGFTLVELMIVITIIALLAGIAIFSALRTRMKANEGAAEGAFKSILSGSVSYRNNMGGYPASLAVMGSSYLGGGLETGLNHGYRFTLAPGNNNETFTVIAVPVTPGFSGVHGFCADVSNTIYVYDSGSGLVGDGSECPAGGQTLQ